MSHEYIIPEQCYFCANWKPNEEAEKQRLDEFKENTFDARAGIKGECMVSGNEGVLVSVHHRKRHQESHISSSQAVCHVTLEDKQLFEPHTLIDEDSMATYYADRAKKLDDHE